MSSKGIIPNLRPDIKKSPLNREQISKMKFEAQERRQLEASNSYIMIHHHLLPSNTKIENNTSNTNLILKQDSDFIIDDPQCNNFSETTPTPPSDIILTNKTKNQPSLESFTNFKAIVLQKKQNDSDYYPCLGLELVPKKKSDNSKYNTDLLSNISSASSDQVKKPLIPHTNKDIPTNDICPNSMDNDKSDKIESNSNSISNNNHNPTDDMNTDAGPFIELNEQMVETTKVPIDEKSKEQTSIPIVSDTKDVYPSQLIRETCLEILPETQKTPIKDTNIIDEFIMESPLDSLLCTNVTTQKEYQVPNNNTVPISNLELPQCISNDANNVITTENVEKEKIATTNLINDTTNINSNLEVVTDAKKSTINDCDNVNIQKDNSQTIPNIDSPTISTLDSQEPITYNDNDITKNKDIAQFDEIFQNGQLNPIDALNMDELLNVASPVNDKELEQALNFFGIESKDSNSTTENMHPNRTTSDLLNDCFSMVMGQTPPQVSSPHKVDKPSIKSVQNTTVNKTRPSSSNKTKRTGSAKANNTKKNQTTTRLSSSKNAMSQSTNVDDSLYNVTPSSLSQQTPLFQQQALGVNLNSAPSNVYGGNIPSQNPLPNNSNYVLPMNNGANQSYDYQQKAQTECINVTDANNLQALLSQGMQPEQQPQSSSQQQSNTTSTIPSNMELSSYSTNFLNEITQIFKNDINGQYIRLRNGIDILATNENYQLYNYLKQLLLVLINKHLENLVIVDDIRRLVEVLNLQLRVPNINIDNDKIMIYNYILSLLTSYCNGYECVRQNRNNPSSSRSNSSYGMMPPTTSSSAGQTATTSSGVVSGQPRRNQYMGLNNTPENKFVNNQVNNKSFSYTTTTPNLQNPSTYINIAANQQSSFVANTLGQHNPTTVAVQNNNYTNSGYELPQTIYNNNNNTNRNSNNNVISRDQINQQSYNNPLMNQGCTQVAMLPSNTTTTTCSKPMNLNVETSTQQQQEFINNFTQKQSNIQRLINIPSNGPNGNSHSFTTVPSTQAPSITNISNIDMNDFSGSSSIIMGGGNAQIPLVTSNNGIRQQASKTYYTNNSNTNTNPITLNDYIQNPVSMLAQNLTNHSQNNHNDNNNNNTQKYPTYTSTNDIVEVGDNRNGRGQKIFIIPSNNINGQNYQIQNQQLNLQQQPTFVNSQQLHQKPNQNQLYLSTNKNATILLPNNQIIMNQQQQQQQLDPNDHYRLRCSLKNEVDKEYLNRMNVNKLDPNTNLVHLQQNSNPLTNSFVTPTPQVTISNAVPPCGVVNGVSVSCENDNRGLQLPSLVWHKIQYQFESQIRQKLESINPLENNFFQYQITLKSKLETFINGTSGPFIEKLPNIIQLFAHPHIQSTVTNSFLNRIRSGQYEVPFAMMDRFLAFINLLAVNLLICAAKKYDCLQLHSLYTECENYLNTLIKICSERPDIPYLEPFFNHIFLRIRCLIQKRICENKILIFKAVNNINNLNNEQDVITFTKQYCDMAAQHWNQANSLAQTIKPQIDFLNYFLPKLEVNSSLVYMSHYLYVIIIICAYHSK